MDPLSGLLGHSDAIRALREKLRLLSRGHRAQRPPNVLIEGETGTGKGHVAKLLHRLGSRSERPFVDVNCAAIPDTLLEAELFGYERGAFTDARHAKPGLFQMAHGGTLFLDEIGLLSEPVQAKLLKVIEDRAVRRLGGTRNEPVDAWLVSATNADLAADIRERRFREDLYHRLAVMTVKLPPLRERGEDVLLLADHFLGRASADYGLPRRALAPDARERVLSYSWPGNLRELANAMERAALLSETSLVTASMLDLGSPSARRGPAARRSPGLGQAMRQHVAAVLEETGWNISRSASILGIARNTLRTHIRRLGLTPRSAQPAPPVGARPAPVLPGAPPERSSQTVPVRWERRRVTLLRVVRVAAGDGGPDDGSGRWLEVLIDKVRAFGGVIQELAPTGFDAAFGLEPVEDGPRRAAHAALAMQKATARAREEGADTASLTTAIHTAQVMVGVMVEGTHIDQGAKREALRTLRALMAAAEPGTIVVSSVTAFQLERRLELVPLPAIPESGAGAYRLLGRERAGLGLGEAMARFVGRRHELDLLGSRAAAAARGRGQMVALFGEAGVGKSRLVWEFMRGEQGRDWRRLHAVSTSYGTTTSYLPVIQLLRDYFEIDASDTAFRARERVRAALAALGQRVAAVEPAVLSLLDIPVGHPGWGDLDPRQRRQHTIDGVKRLLLAASRAHPLLLVFEDVHWIDTESQALLDALVEALPAAAMLLVVTYRPEYRHGWATRSFYTQLRVDPLPREHAAELLEALVGQHPTVKALAPRLIDLTEGNPFFLEETVRTLVETGVLAGTPGAYELVKAVPYIEVPATVEEMLAARIDRLPCAPRSVLQCAAVIGKTAELSVLAAVSDLPEEALREALAQLQAAELLRETGPVPGREYSLKHALTHQVAYARLLPERRRALHARSLSAMETRYADILGDRVDQLAHHAFHGEVWDKAVGYLRQAAAKAFARAGNREAVECLDLALAALGHLPETRETLEQAIDLRFRLRDSLWGLAALDRLHKTLQEAEALADMLGDERRRGWVACYLSHYLAIVADAEHAVEAGEQALRVAGAIDDWALELESEVYLGIAYFCQGRHTSTVEVLRRALVLLERHPDVISPGVRVSGPLSCAWLVRALAELGELEEAAAYGREGLRLAEAAANPFGLATAQFGMATVRMAQGEYREAAALLEPALELCRLYRLESWVPAVAASLGFSYVQGGRLDEGLLLLEQAVTRAEAMRFMASLSQWLGFLCEAYLGAGRSGDARRLAQRALRMSRERREKGYEARALRLLAEVAARASPPDVEAAERFYGEALALAEALGMRPLAAACHLGRSRLQRDTGAMERGTE